MVSCLACVAMFLMGLKLVIWHTIARFYASMSANTIYFVATILMLWTYTLAVMTDAGVVTLDVLDEEELKEQGYCERCDRMKPPRVHHCSVCRRCVYRMDHHCPWTSNCVGWRNKKYFLLFLLYTSISCLVFCGLVTPLVWSDTPPMPSVRRAHMTLLQLGWTLSLVIGLVLVGYFVFHVWLLRQGKTTLEFLAGRPGEFEYWSFWRHVSVYFGRYPVLWLVPVPPHLDPRLRGRVTHEREKLMV